MSTFKRPKKKSQPKATSSQTFGPKVIRSVQRQTHPTPAQPTLNNSSNHFSLYGSGQPMALQRDLQNPEANINWNLRGNPNTLHRSLEGGREHSHPELMLSHRKPSQRKNMEQLQRSLLPKRGDGKLRRVRGSNNMMQLKAIAKLPYDSLQPKKSTEVLQRDKDLALPDTSTPGEANLALPDTSTPGEADIELDKDDVNIAANANDNKDEEENFPVEGEQKTTTTIDDDEEDEWDDDTTKTPMGADNDNPPEPGSKTPMGVDNADPVNHNPMGNGSGQNNVPIISPGGPNGAMPGLPRIGQQPLPRQNTILEFGNFYGSGTSDPITLEEVYRAYLKRLIKNKFNRSISVYKSSKNIRIVDRNPRPKNDEQTKRDLADETNQIYESIKNSRTQSGKFLRKYVKYKSKVKPGNIRSQQTGVGLNNQNNEIEPLYHYETSIQLTMPFAKKWRKGWKNFFKGGYASTVGANQSDTTDLAQEALTQQDGYTIYDRINNIVAVVKGKGGDVPNRVSGLISGNGSFWTWAAPGFGIATLIKNFLDIKKYWRRRKNLQKTLADSETELAQENIDPKKKKRLTKLQEGVKYGIQKLKTLCWTVFVNAFATFVQTIGRILTILIPPAVFGTMFTDVLATVVKLASFAVRKAKGLMKHFKGTRGKQRLISAKAMFDSAVAGDEVGIAAIRALDTKSFLDIISGHAWAGTKKLGKGIGTTFAWPFSRKKPTMKLKKTLDKNMSKKGKDQLQWGRWPTDDNDFKRMLKNISSHVQRKDAFIETLANQIKSSV